MKRAEIINIINRCLSEDIKDDLILYNKLNEDLKNVDYRSIKIFKSLKQQYVDLINYEKEVFYEMIIRLIHQLPELYFPKFSRLYNKLIDMLIKAPQPDLIIDTVRETTIKNFLNLSDIDKLVYKYDYYFEGKLFNNLRSESEITSLVILQANQFVTGSHFGAVELWDIYEFKKLLSQHDQSVRDLTILNNKIVSASFDLTLKSVDLSDNSVKVLSGHKDAILCVIVIGKRIASGSQDSTLRIWNSENEKCEAILEQKGAIYTILEISKNELICGTSLGELTIWNYITNEIIKLEGHKNAITGIKIINNKIISTDWDGICNIWESNKLKRTLKVSNFGIRFLEVSGNTFITGDDNGMVNVFDFEGNLQRSLYNEVSVFSLIVLPDGRICVSVGHKGDIIKIWNDTINIPDFVLQGHSDVIWVMKNLNKYIVSTDKEGIIKIWK